MNDRVLTIADLEHVTGGASSTISGGVMRGFVESLKTLNTTPNRADGEIANHNRVFLTDRVSSKPRPWLGGESINSLTRDMRHTGMVGYPATRFGAR